MEVREVEERMQPLIVRLKDCAQVCRTEQQFEEWTRPFVGDLVKVTMPEYFVEFRKRSNP